MIAAVVPEPIVAETFRQTIERWHDFYLLAGTAAVTLAGLLFVTLSLHIHALVHDSRAHLIAFSRATLSSFIFVLALSLVFLAPCPSQRILATQTISFGVIFAGLTITQLRQRRSDEDPHLAYRHFRRRFFAPLIAYLLIALVGVRLLSDLDALAWMIGLMCMLLGNAATASWELLVRVAQAKGETPRD